MSVFNRGRSTPKPLAPATPPSAVDKPSKPARGPTTRVSATWVRIGATALGLVVLIVFMVQNTGRVAINFLWMNGSLPLALALFIAGAATAMLVTTIGAARMTQLRRLVRRAKSDVIAARDGGPDGRVVKNKHG